MNQDFDFYGPAYTFWICIWLIVGYKLIRRFQKNYEAAENRLVALRHQSLEDHLKTLNTPANGVEDDEIQVAPQVNLEEDAPLIKEHQDDLNSSGIINTRFRDRKIDISFDDLGLSSLNGEQNFLSGVRGDVNSGEMLLVMGPSGCGKSTFLHTLAGRAHYGKTNGTIFVNGIQVQNMQSFKEQIGFVPQEDIMHRILNVKEILSFAANVKLKDEVASKREIIVEELLNMLGLSHVRFSIIGDENTRGISGGQRKRVNLGIELVANPMLLFLDEPTSGLDSSSSKYICENLNQLSQMGLTVIAVLHQPRWEIFEMFHKVLLLAKGGKTVYFGPTKNVEDYFVKLGFPCPNKVNPPDFFLDVISGDLENNKFDPVILTDKWEEITKKNVPLEEKLVGSVQITDLIGLEVTTSVEQSFRGEDIEIMETTKSKLSCFALPINASLNYSVKPEFHFIRGLIACMLTSLIGMYTCLLLNVMSIDSLFGCLVGYLGTFLAISIAMAIFMVNDPVARGFTVLLATICFLSLAYVLYKYKYETRYDLLIGFIIGFHMGPVGFAATLYESFMLPKEKSTIRFGATFAVLFSLLFWIPVAGLRGYLNTINSAILVLLVTFSAAALITIHHHHSRLPNIYHSNVSFFSQLWLFFIRGCTQQLRDYKGIIFDLTLGIIASGFLGVIFFGLGWEAPILNPFGVQNGCPAEIQAIIPQICQFISFPTADPLPSQASLTILALSLCAVASSLRIFGSEKAQFVRETNSGTSTEAYYIGKSFAHMPIVIMAPFLFFLTFCTMANIEAPFWQHYLLLFLIYFCSSGVSYTVSILVKPASAQLVGILVILSNMTFSGANPSLIALQSNKLVPGNYLIYPTYQSFIRWGQELHYLLEIQQYPEAAAQGYLNMETFWGYYLTDEPSCWIWLVVIGIVYRVIAYVALVKQEE